MPSPGVIAAVLFVLGILNFKEVRNNIASPLILMMAGVIGVAGRPGELRLHRHGG